MTIPQQNLHDYSCSLKTEKVPMEVETNFMKKKKQRLTYSCNKFIINENTCSVNVETIRKLDMHSPSMDRAMQLESKLPVGFPTCVKFMRRSHVTGGFWLSLPRNFSNLHMPNHDTIIILVDENDKEYITKYLVDKNGLSGGWRGFSIAHKLQEGDALVFQLIRTCRIKVYIVRANNLSEIDGDGAIAPPNLELKNVVKTTIVKEENQDMEDVNNYKKVENNEEEDIAKNSVKGLNIDDGGDKMVLTASESDTESGNETDEMFDGIRFSKTVLDFKDTKEDFEKFRIIVDGLVIDSEIPKHLRVKYYNLCCSQNLFLHDHLVKGLNCKLAAGIISETVNIADAIRAAAAAAKLETYCWDYYLRTWDKTLKAFEDMGMAVGFLRDGIKKLVCLQRHEEREVIIKLKTLERDQVEMDEKNLEAELVRVKKVKGYLDAEIESLKLKSENLVAAIKEMATAPW